MIYNSQINKKIPEPVNRLNFQVLTRPKAAEKNQKEMRGMHDQHGEKLPTNAENIQNE